MKKIGILGGMSVVSSQLYYKIFCELTSKKLGKLHSPNIILRSVNFEPITQMMNRNEWEKIAKILNFEVLCLRDAGAELIVIASNTMHKIASEIMENIDLPIVHIAKVTTKSVMKNKLRNPAFLATKFTMENKFYVDILKKNSLYPKIPNNKQRKKINDIIFQELCQNKVLPKSEKIYLNVIEDLKQKGADSIILGCTELCLILNKNNTNLPVFDSTQIHCEAAIDIALK